MNLNELKKSIVVCDRDYFPLLLQFKNAHADIDFKLMDRKQFLQDCSFAYRKDPLVHMVSDLHIPYREAKQYLNLLQVADLSKSEMLARLYRDLASDYIQTDDLSQYEFSNKTIYLLELQEDASLHSVLTRKGYRFVNLTLADLEIPKIHDLKEKAPAPILYFKTRYQQYSYLFSQIRMLLTQHPESKSNVKVLFKNDNIFYPKLFSSLYQIPVSLQETESLSIAPGVTQKLESFYRERKFEFSEDELKLDSLKKLKDVIDKYRMAELDFDFAYANLLEIIAALQYRVMEPKEGLTFTDSFALDPKSSVFVVDFSFDFFYHVSKPNNVLLDQDLLDLGVTTSYQQTQLDERKKRNYLEYMNIIFLSRVLQHLNDKMFDSQFISDYHWEPYIQKVSLSDTWMKDGAFTENAMRLAQSFEVDSQFVSRPVEGIINAYDYQYKPISENIYKDKKNYSVTDLEQYINCPFRFYMSKVLPMAPSEYTFILLGILLHRVMEDFFHPDFDFEHSFQEGMKEYEDNAKKLGVTITGKDRTMIEVVHRWFSKYLMALSKMKEEATILSNENDSERKVTFSLKDENGRTYPFVGYIDKILLTQHSNQSYYTIIDYKTGIENFSPELVPLGKSIQLPLYYYAIESMDEETRRHYVQDAQFGGFGIQHIYFSTFSKAFGNANQASLAELEKSFMIKGVILDATEYLLSLNDDLQDEDDDDVEPMPTFFQKSATKDEEGISLKVSRKGAVDFDVLLHAGMRSAIETIHKIENAQFDIAPTSYSLKSKNEAEAVCGNCSYADVCYHNIFKDFKNYSKQMKEFEKKNYQR